MSNNALNESVAMTLVHLECLFGLLRNNDF